MRQFVSGPMLRAASVCIVDNQMCAVIFTSACVLLALETAPTTSWAHQSGLLGPKEMDALSRAIRMLDQLRHRGRNIEVSYHALTCVREAHIKGEYYPVLTFTMPH